MNYLERVFKKFPYIETCTRKEIADRINISDRAVKIWFQNRRMKEKKENGINYQYGIINKVTQVNENNDINSDVSNESLTKEKMLLPSQNKPQHLEGPKISKTDKKDDTVVKKSDYSMDRIIKISPRMRNNTITPSTSSTPQANMCSSYDNVNITSKYFENTNTDHLRFQHLRRDLPQDMSSKKRLTKKSMSSNQQYVSVNSNSEQKYLPMYNYCTSSLPTGGPVMTSVPVSTGSTGSQGNVIWKPINMQPPPTMPPVRMNCSNEIPLVNQNTARSCNCNCHEFLQNHSKITGFNQDPRMQPQYLLAIPLITTCNQM